MVYEANPAAISHLVSYGLPTSAFLKETLLKPFAMYSLYPEAAKLNPGYGTILHFAVEAAVRKYSPRSHSYCPEASVRTTR
jgi:hypothetical protein